MTTVADPFPDLLKSLVVGLPPLLEHPGGGTIKAGTSFGPDQQTGSDAFLRIGTLLAPDDRFTRTSMVEFDFFAARRDVGYALGEQLHGLLHSIRRVGGTVIDQVVTVSGPTEAPWDNTDVRRFLSTYRIFTRR